jgi:predicted LPLAT superfamily acyltransferase
MNISMNKSKTSQSAGTGKRGNKLGFWFFEMSLRVFGLRGAYGLLYVVCLYYVLFDSAALTSALPYIDRQFPGSGFLKKRFRVYRLFISQGKQLIDRYAAVINPKLFNFHLKGAEEFFNLLRNSTRGLILLTTHVGNWQIAMTTLNKMEKTVYLLMRPEDNPAVQNSLRVGHEGGGIKVISPQAYMGGIVEIMNVLKAGHVVSIMGDRSYGARTLAVPFLGENAHFPYSAFAIAAAAECPVVLLFSVKDAFQRYIVDVSNVLYPRYTGRRNKEAQLRPWVEKFAGIIENFVRQYPYQCFLFCDVWKKEE